MDFLQLLPQSSRHSQLIFCNYRHLGLLCWSAAEPNQIVMVSALVDAETVKSDKILNKSDCESVEDTPNVLFKRVLTIFLSPELPNGAEFSQILVNKNGNLLALVGKCMVFIVELDPDLWDYRRQISSSLDFDSSMEHLKSEYFARCDLLHFNLFMRKYAPFVLKAVWFEPQKDSKEYFDNEKFQPPGGLLALLYSDSVIRLYDVNSVIDRPFAVLDFNTILSDRTPSESGEEFNDNNSGVDSRPHSTFGFVTQIVSFDFGPVFPISGQSNKSTSSLLGSTLALDMNGGIYISFFRFQNFNNTSILSSLTPIGPLPCIFPMVGPQSPSISSKMICSAIDLHFIRHSHSQLIPILAIASEDGFLAHLILTHCIPADVQSSFKIEQLTSEGNFNLFAFEFMQISSDQKLNKISKIGTKNLKKKAHNLPKILSILLRHDPFDNSSSCSYFVICARNLFRFDLTSVLNHLIKNCGDNQLKNKNSSFPQSIIHHLLAFDDDGVISSIASLELSRPLSLSNFNKSKNCKTQYQLIAALYTSQFEELNENGKIKTKYSHRFLATLFNRGSNISTTTDYSSPFSNSSIQQKQTSTSQELSTEVRRQLNESVEASNNSLASTLPSINFNKEDNISQRISTLSLMQNAIQNIFIDKALPVRQHAINYTLKKAENILKTSSEVEKLRESIQQRLMVLFRQVNDIKAQILKRQYQFRLIDERIQKIAQTLQPVMFATSNDEIEALDKLQNMQKKILERRRDIQILNSRISEYRQNLFGSDTKTSTSFNELIPAQMFILSKNERQCNKLREQIIFLENKISEFK